MLLKFHEWENASASDASASLVLAPVPSRNVAGTPWSFQRRRESHATTIVTFDLEFGILL
jgi:hypothetical protein